MDVSTNDNLHEKVNVSHLKHALHFYDFFCSLHGMRGDPRPAHWAPGLEVWVRDLAESSSCVHGQGTLASQCLSLQPGQ